MSFTSNEAFLHGMSGAHMPEVSMGGSSEYWEGYVAVTGALEATRLRIQAQAGPTEFTQPYLAVDGTANVPANFAQLDPNL